MIELKEKFEKKNWKKVLLNSWYYLLERNDKKQLRGLIYLRLNKKNKLLTNIIYKY